MKGLLSVLAVLGLVVCSSAKADVGCTYSFDSRFSSKQVNIELDIEGKKYKHVCIYADKVADEAGGNSWVYACASVQNFNVSTYFVVNVKEGYVYNSYNEGSLVHENLEDVLATCKRK